MPNSVPISTPFLRLYGPLLILVAVISLCCLGRGGRIGDGHEYYLMTIAVAEGFQPWGTPEIGVVYDRYIQGQPSFSLTYDRVSIGAGLNYGKDQRDYPHFWLYSAAAAIFYHPLKLLGLDIGYSFNLLHLTLLSLGLWLVHRVRGHAWALAYLTIVLFSPAVWYLNKAHTEFFTIVVGCLALALLSDGRLAGSALCLSVLSTQNPPFALLVAPLFLLALLRSGREVRRRPGVWLLTGVLLTLHPAYYFFRHGAVTPQFASGAARLDQVAGLRELTCYLVDPDVGLIVNWPPVLMILLAFTVLAGRGSVDVQPVMLAFSLLWLGVCAWAQAKTTNFNSGGSLHIARYALWYMPLLLWPLASIYQITARSSPRRRLLVGLLVGVCSGASLYLFWPARVADRLRQSDFARLLYRELPEIYDPVPEIFAERILGQELTYQELWAVANSDATKVLINTKILRTLNPGNLPPVAGCPTLDPRLVYALALQKSSRLHSGTKSFYLNSSDLKSAGSS